ncbi:MAG TPA: acyl carrier protein [Phycisphaerales bacterium]|nr:acyl carrier protein [Phycisphaerales bacterium]HCD31756.1 acyl carrier protein [Phycisphaerales bacterium]|tara:strand:+ start:258 stop:503 length:246 start_codon:yes stop_codon:yes gene_type:complete
MSDTLSKVTEVFIDVFDDDEIELELETTAEDVDAWDSLMHVTLMLNIEKAFGVRFASSEVAGLKNIGELVGLIEAKTAVAS